MRTLFKTSFLFPLGALLVLPAVSRVVQAQTSYDLRREIDSLNRAMEATFNRGDLLGVSRFYADDARLMGPRESDVSGREAIDRYWTGIKGAKSWKLEVLEVGGDRNTAYQVGRSTLVTAGPSGDHASVSRFVVIWKRQRDGQLKMALDFYHF
jgi:ketosteroid isomerase-like protein